MHNSIETNSLLSLLIVNLFSAKHSAFTKSILRGWIFHRIKNEFKSVHHAHCSQMVN